MHSMVLILTVTAVLAALSESFESKQSKYSTVFLYETILVFQTLQ